MTHNTASPDALSQDIRPAGQFITNQLIVHGFGAQGRLWDGTCTLTIIGVQQARSCLTIDDHGGLRWEYEPRPGPRTSPAALTRIVLHVLGTAPADGQPLDDSTYPAFLLKGAVGRLAQANGLTVELLTYQDLESFDVVGEINVTNPERPERGEVRITDDGFLAWHCQAQQAFTGGLGAIVAVIAPILRQGISARPGPAPDRDGHPQPEPATPAPRPPHQAPPA